MSEPEDELTPLPEHPPGPGSRLVRSPYVALGVAAVVVSTVFATVAALAGSREEQAGPSPESRGTIESTTYETDTTDPTTTTTTASSTSSAPMSSTTTTTTTTMPVVDDEEPPAGDDGNDGITDPTTPHKPTTTQPTTTTTPKPPPNKAPTASFTFSCDHLACTFDGGGSADSDGEVRSYSWSFGKTGASVSHTYGEPGTYQVTLTVTDDDGATASASDSVTVEAPPTTTGN